MSKEGSAAIEKIGAFASLVCIIHCLGIAILAPLIPAMGILSHSEEIEIAFWCVAGLTAFWQGMRTHGWLRALFLSSFILGTLAALLDIHLVLHLAFAGVAGGQIILLWRRKRAHSCEHDHD